MKNHDDRLLMTLLRLMAADLIPWPSMRPDGALSDDEVADAIRRVPAHFASSFSGQIAGRLAITETMLATDVPNLDSGDPTLKFTLGQGAENIAGVTAIASMQKALAAGVGTIDFTALTHRGAAVSFNGLKNKYVAFQNPATNANPITIVQGAANALQLFGTTFSITLQPGDYFAFRLNNSNTVDATHKNIDLSGTAAQVLNLLVAGG